MTADGGLFQAPAAPPATPRLRIDPGSTPRRLSLAIVRAALAWVGAGAALVVLYNVATMMLPLVIGGVIDAVVTPAAGGARAGDLVGTMVWWGSAVVGLYVLMNLTYRFGGRVGWYGLQRTEYELSQAVAARILDPRGFAGNRAAPGALLSVATADVHRACLVLYAAVYPPGEIVGLVVAIGVLFAVHPWLGLGVLLTLPHVVGVMHLAARPLRRRSLTEQAGIADAAASAADLVAGFRVIRGVHAEDEASRRYRTVSRSALTGTIAARDARAAYTGLSAAIAGVFAAAVLAAAVLLALDGAITAGGLVTVGGVAVSIVGPLDALVSQLGAILAMSQASTARVLDLLDRPRDDRALGDRDPGAGLRLENLRLAGGLTVDADVPDGDMSVLAVPAPARRELAEVLVGRGAAAGGRVLLGGVDLAECHVDARRERMLVAPHRPDILAGTVLENVRTAGPGGATREEARKALRLAGMTDAELPDGEGTACAEGGTNLSGGQRQRIALARAIAADPDILVLLEPTSSVDSVTETAIAGELARHRRGRTTLVVAGSGAFAHAAATRLTARGTDD